MKKLKILVMSFLLGGFTYGQGPIGNPPSPNTVPNNANSAWYRGGNNIGGTNPIGANIFGTMWNSPIYTYTNGVNRTKLNGTFNAATQYTIEGYGTAQGVNTSGYLLLGQDGQTQNGNPSLFNSKGAFSMLHLNGVQNTNGGGFVQEFGFRPWMKTGVTFTGNNDLMYFGIRALSAGQDLSEMGVTWSDNSGNGFPGPDDFVFRFTSGGAGNTTISNNLTAENDLDGRHVARFTGTGEFGLGNTFGIGNPIYVRPASLQHLSLSNNRSVYTQFTNRNTAVGSGTGETAADGLRVGILGNNVPNRNGNALIYNQENRHLLFSTNANTNAVNPLNTRERMRVTSINAPTELASNGYGVYNPANLNGNLTRVSISHNPINPVTRPLSLLHLGYNTGANSFPAGSTDGWRNWMDIGTFTSNGTDNMYVGLKTEAGAFPASDRQDAVINWGDNDASNPLNGPDNLRFIFTSTTTGAGNTPANSNNGLEVARMVPTLATTLTPANYGMMGIGDWTTPANIATPIDAKLDIDGDLRIRQIENDNTLYKVLVVDEPDHNRVHWRDLNSFTLGNVCGSATPNPLTGNYEIRMNNNDFYFSSLANSGKVLIGDVFCGSGSNSRVYIRNNSNSSGLQKGIFVQSNDPNGIGGDFTGELYGLRAEGNSSNPFSRAGYFVGLAESTVTGILVSDQMFKTNVEGIKGATDILRKLQPHTYKMDTINFPQFNFQSRLQYGFIAQEIEGVLPALVHESYMPAVYDSSGNEVNAAVNYKSLNYNALIPITVQAVNEINEKIDKSTLSDQTVKTNVQTLNGSLEKVKQMRGVSYEWSSAAQNTMNLDSIAHIGFIAQEVAAIEPLLTFVDDSSLVHVNYDRVAPLLVESVKELDAKNHVQDSIIQFLDSINNDLKDRLTILENCINEANLCGGNERTSNNQENEGKVIQLENLNAIILDQNLPNPFAEKTSINYTIPKDVVEAQLLFYDMNGRIIKQVDITERGEGKLTVYGENLQNGVYTYSLIADGKLIATKKMVKQ